MRKVLSFVLVLTLVLSSFSMAFAADTKASTLTDIGGTANEDAIQVAYDLDIVTGNPDGTYLPDKAVTRAEFAAMITRALAIPDSALAGYSTTSFLDTTGYSWAVPYLAFTQSKGIMLGDGAGNAMPGKTINMNEAVTMALRAIGYTANSAELVGVWPSNYVTIAQNLGLYDDVTKATDVNKAMAAQIVYNLLTVQKVVVNANGDTTWLYIDKDDEDPANLLNTNLGCTAYDDEILGDNYSYDDAIISISSKIGAFGTAYLNDDDELVAFVPDSTALTGKVDGTKFKVGDVKYDFDTNEVTTGVAIANGDATDAGEEIDATFITDFAGDNTNDGETVTIYAEVSGKKIKDIYSVVGWKATVNDKASSDVQDDITDDTELLGVAFDTDDDDAIKVSSFSLVGVDSLDKIAEDDVVYVYESADDEVIRKVEVGTETIEGIVDETDEDNTVTIDGKDYDIAKVAGSLVLTIPGDVDIDSDGTFFLDVNGDIYDFDGTGSVDTYGVVKAFAAQTSFDNFKIKLYKSDDSTSTVYLADDTDEIDYVSGANDGSAAIVTGALIGYSFDKDGDIDTIDDTAVSYSAVNFQSTKVLKVTEGAVTTSYSIDANAVVFTYDDEGYDVASLNEVDKGVIATVATNAAIILNGDDKVAALLVHSSAVSADDDDVYGVFNTRKSAKDSNDDAVYKFTGYIDGASFTKLTDDQSGFDGLAGVFGVYKITVDVNDVITKVVDLEDEFASDSASGTVVADAVIKSLSSDKTVITDTADKKWTVADDAVVYKYDEDDEEFSVAKLSSLKKDYTVTLYDTKGDDADGVATVVIYFED